MDPDAAGGAGAGGEAAPLPLPRLLAPERMNAAGFDVTPSPAAAAILAHHARTISSSVPTSPTSLDADGGPALARAAVADGVHGTPNRPPRTRFSGAGGGRTRPPKVRSQPLPMGVTPARVHDSPSMLPPAASARRPAARVGRYDSFKTWTGKLERQLTTLRGRPPPPPVPETTTEQQPTPRSLPTPRADRFYAALEGPELDKLKATEQLELPDDRRWPFLLRFPVSAFGMCLGVGSQSILWKTIAAATVTATSLRTAALRINLLLWLLAAGLWLTLAATYLAKIVFFFEAVRREYYHPVRVNFFFAPWIACLFLAMGLPPLVTAAPPHESLWYVLMAPIFVLELKIYGQWMSGGNRRLSKVANPSNHLSVVGNFVGALLGASMGLREGPIFFFAVGLAHYAVLFVTLYQRLPTNETLPKELHPVFFLFVAAPSVASTAWAKISGEFGYVPRLAFFISLFLYASLAVRVNFFRGFKFSLAWWAYTFPMTGAAIAAIRYAGEVETKFAKILSIALSAVSMLAVSALTVTTAVHAFVLRDLLPNDVAIAITHKKVKPLPVDDDVDCDGGAAVTGVSPARHSSCTLDLESGDSGAGEAVKRAVDGRS